MKIVLKEVTDETHKKAHMRYFYVYDEENPIDLEKYEDRKRRVFSIVGSVREYTDKKELDMDIANWAWYKRNSEYPNYRNNGYGKALFAHLMNEVLPQKNDEEWRITIGHRMDDAISFYEHNFSQEHKIGR